MSYRDRRLAKADRLRGWAEKREAKSAAAFGTARHIADGIPFGQPILVGHHSEKHARRDQDRIHNGMAKGIEHERMAASMSSRAAEIDRQAEHAIYSDDDDVCDRLRERIATLEAERERVKAVNKAVRAHGLQRLIQPDPPFALTVEEKREFLKLMTLCPYHKVEERGWPTYHLQNLSGNINRQKKRLAELERAAPCPHGTKPYEHACAVCGQKPPAYPSADEPGAAIVAEVMAVIDVAYAAMAEDRDPIAAMAEAIDTAERTAPPLADVPFSLTPVIGRAGGKQNGLF